LNKLRHDYGDYFNDHDFASWSNLAIAPEPKNESVSLLQLLASNNVITIGISSHDPREHAIYQKKLKDTHQIDTKKLFTTIIGIPSVESIPKQRMLAFLCASHFRLGHNSSAKQLLTPVYKKIYQYVVQEENFDNFVVAPSSYPSEEFIETLRTTAHQIKPHGTLFIIDPNPQRIASIPRQEDCVTAAATTLPELQQLSLANGK
jgi:hypothetical protein